MLNTDIFYSHVQQSGLIANDERLIIAFSSGPDSMALLFLLLLCNWEKQAGWELIVAHLDHSMQPESVSEAEYVRSICARFDLVCVQEVEDVPDLAKQRGLGLEEAGRFARYRFLSRAADQYGASCLVFGHQGDDQVEHFWLRLLRGASPQSVSGIPQTRKLSPDVRIVRPLLPFSRAEVLSFLDDCREQYPHFSDLVPFQDPDNMDNRYMRNNIRRHLVPILDHEYPGWRRSLLRYMAIVYEDEDYLQSECSRAISCGRWHLGLYRFAYKEWLGLHPALRKRVIIRIFSMLGDSALRQPIQSKHLQHLEDTWLSLEEGKTLQLPGGCALQLSADELFFLHQWPPQPWNIQAGMLSDTIHTESVLLPWSDSNHPVSLSVSLVERTDRRGSASNYMSSAWLHHTWHIRSWQATDRVHIGSHRQKPGEVFRSRGIRGPERSCYPVIIIDNELAAIAGLVTAERFRPAWDEREVIELRLI